MQSITVLSHLETKERIFSRDDLQWLEVTHGRLQKGAFSFDTITKEIDGHLPQLLRWRHDCSHECKCRYRFNRITNCLSRWHEYLYLSRESAGVENLPEYQKVKSVFEGMQDQTGNGVSKEKFFSQYGGILPIADSPTRQALGVLLNMLHFFARFPFESHREDDDRGMSLNEFTRSLLLHAELNYLFNLPFFREANSIFFNQDEDENCAYVGPRVLKTAADLRRLLFRSLSRPLPDAENIDGRTEIPVLQCIRHEHETTLAGSLRVIEHRYFALEDERSVELQDILALSRTVGHLKPSRPLPREMYREVPETLPRYRYDLRQLGIDKACLTVFLNLLTRVSPSREGLHIKPSIHDPKAEVAEWRKYLESCEDQVRWPDFDELVRKHVPHFYVQVSKLIGFLLTESDGEDPEMLKGAHDGMENILYTFTSSNRKTSFDLPESFMFTGEATQCLLPTGGCWECTYLYEMEDGLEHTEDEVEAWVALWEPGRRARVRPDHAT